MTKTIPQVVVLADDDELICMAYKHGLERAGFVVYTAQNGQEAIDLIKQHHPSLVLLDLIMPKLNGFVVLKLIKTDDELKDIPVAVLSNLSKATDEAEVRSLGAIDFLVKADHSLKEVIDKTKEFVKHA